MTQFADTFLQGTRVGLDARSDAERLRLAREAEIRRAAEDQFQAQIAAERLQNAQDALDERSRQFDERQGLASEMAQWRQDQAQAKAEAAAAAAEEKKRQAEQERQARATLAGWMASPDGGGLTALGSLFGDPAMAGALPTGSMLKLAGERASARLNEERRLDLVKALQNEHADISKDIMPGGRSQGDRLKRKGGLERLSIIERQLDELEMQGAGAHAGPWQMYRSNEPGVAASVPRVNAAAASLLSDLLFEHSNITAQLGEMTPGGYLSSPKPRSTIYADAQRTRPMSREVAQKRLSDITPLIGYLQSVVRQQESDALPANVPHANPASDTGSGMPPVAAWDASVPFGAGPPPEQQAAAQDDWRAATVTLTPEDQERVAELMGIEGLTYEDALRRIEGERESPE